MKKILHLISIMALILPSIPIHAGKDETDGTRLVQLDKEGVTLESVSLLEGGQPKQLTRKEKEEIRLKRQQKMCCFQTTAVTCGSTLLVGGFIGFMYFTFASLNPPQNPVPAPTPRPNPCADLCWYLREFPGLPQGGYFIPHPCGCNRTFWEFVNCTTGVTTTFSTMLTTVNNETTTSVLPTTAMMMTNVTNATTTTYHRGEVGFIGEHDNYTVCQHIPAPTPISTNTTMMLNATTVKELIEATGGTVDKNDEIPELVEIERDIE